MTNSDCDDTQKCKDGKCESVCSPNPCPDGKECIPENHAAKCGCTDTSCGTGLKCVDSDCVPCTKGDKCGCAGSKVFDGESGCYCAGETACSAAKEYSEDLCSCKSCDPGKKCGCAGKSVSDGFGACVCLEDEVCDPGNKQDKTTCTCTPCAAGDNAGCETPCPEGQVPDGKGGCGTYACTSDSDCPEGNQCKNPSTLDAYCDPCTRGTSCNCPAGKVADGTGNCVAIACDADATCSGEMCCKLNPAYGEGYTCANGGSVDAICVLCEIGTQCTCDDGYIVNDQYKCVKPECKTNSDCPNGKYCENPGKSNAECVPCKEGEPCPTCPPGYVADGNGGCKLGCTFDTAPLCVSGTANCKTCTQSGGCYTCTDCKDGYYPDNGTCVSCKQKFGDDCEKCTPNKCTTCDDGYEPDPYTGKCKPKACPSGYSTTIKCENGTKEAVSSYYSGASVCKKCVNCAAGEQCNCPAGQISDGNGGCKTACTYTTNAMCVSGSSNCASCSKDSDGCYNCSACAAGFELKNNACEPKACPNGYTAGLTCGDGFTTDKNGKSGTQDCVKCSVIPCSSASFPGNYKNFSTTKPACTTKSEWYTKALGKSGDATCYACACDGTTFGGGGCCSGGKVTCSGKEGPCVECCNDSGCPDGKKCVNSSCVADCPSGYSTSVTSCTGNEKLETNGSSGGKACGKCVSSTTCEALGYQDTLGPWTSTCVSGGGKPKQTKLSSGRTCYYCDKGTSCSSMSSSFFEVGSKTCPTGETAVYTGQSANGKKCYWCKASCSKWGYFAKGKGNCSSTQKEVETTQTGTEGKCYTCAKKTCEDYGLTSDPSKSPQPNFVVTTINGTKCYCVNCSNSGASSSSGTSSSDSCSSLTSGKIPNGDSVCTKKSDGSFYFSYIKLSSGSTGYSLSQSGVSTSLVSCSCTSKSRYGTSCVQASCTHKYGGSSFTVTGSF